MNVYELSKKRSVSLHLMGSSYIYLSGSEVIEQGYYLCNLR